MSLPPPSAVTLALHHDGPALFVTLNRPEVKNAMSAEMVTELGAVFDAIRDDRTVRAVILRGAGGTFCAGGDIRTMAATGDRAPEEPDPVAAGNRRFGELCAKVNAAPQVVITVLEGAVLGGGLGLACVSDIAIAHAGASFGMPETTLGILPAQIAPFVVRRIGLTAARRYGVTGARFDGPAAHALGLVHYVCDDDAAIATTLATVLGQIRRCAPAAVAATKALMLAVDEVPLEALLDRAAVGFAAAIRGPEGREGTQAFVQKRKPGWAE